MGKKIDIFYFSSTHWDREWYQTFQGFRYRLVKLVDNLLDLFENDPEYKTFHFDGQTIVLEDYLEICPEKKEQLEKLIADGKILIGPWYVMPDEFLPSGESLIRNLMIGHKISEDWNTKPWKYGYICDIFGHIAQTPQIFNGFDIKYSLLGRGTQEDDPTYFRWQSPDGSEVLNFKLEPEEGYCSFMLLYARANDVHSPEFDEQIKKYIDSEIARSELPVVILMDGADHNEASVNTTDFIKRIKKLYPDAEVHHENLCKQGELLEKYRDQLPVIQGELNKPAKHQHGYLHLIANTLSSHYPIKKANDECQNLLEKTLEPMLVMADFDGITLNRNYIKTAYKHLIQNHPHDSICGCSIDHVHKDMEYRFDQVKEIGETILSDFMSRGSPTIKPQNGEAYENMLTFQNFLPYDIEKTVTVHLDFPREYPAHSHEPFGYEEFNTFKIYDESGTEIPYQLVYVKPNFRTLTGFFDRHTVTMKVSVPAFGTSSYKAVPHASTVRYLKKMKAGMDFAENDFIRVDILSNGSLKITDKKTGKEYNRLGNLVDDGEIGDGWFHVSPVSDTTVCSHKGCCSIERVEYGPSRCVFKITRELSVPEMLDKNTRSDKTVTLKFETFVGLSEENRFVDIKLCFDNLAKDHRLRMFIPTGIDRDEYFSGQAFYCCQRKTGVDPESGEWYEADKCEKSTNGIVGKRDENGNGLAFISANGLHECAAFDDEDGTIAITLLRSFRRTVRTAGETKCQLNIPLEYSFILAPTDSDVSYCDMLKIQDSLAQDPAVIFTTVPCKTPTKPSKSRLKIGGNNIVTSIVKKAESDEDNAIIIRVFNASDKETTGFINTEKIIERAEITNLNEEKICDIESESNSLDFSLSPWKIGTFKIYFRR